MKNKPLQQQLKKPNGMQIIKDMKKIRKVANQKCFQEHQFKTELAYIDILTNLHTSLMPI